jgi:hypothetical protein
VGQRGEINVARRFASAAFDLQPWEHARTRARFWAGHCGRMAIDVMRAEKSNLFAKNDRKFYRPTLKLGCPSMRSAGPTDRYQSFCFREAVSIFAATE